MSRLLECIKVVGSFNKNEIEENITINESDKAAAKSIEDCQKWVDYDMKTYGHVSKETQDIIDKAGFQIIKDEYGDYEVAAKDYEPKTESSIFQNSEVEPMFKVGDVVIPTYDPGAGYTDKNRMNIKYKITEVGDYDKSNGFKYLAEPITDEAKQDLIDNNYPDSEYEDKIEFYGFEGDPYDSSCGLELVEESKKTEDILEGKRYTICVVTDLGTNPVAYASTEDEAKGKARKLLDIVDSGVSIYDRNTGDEITLDDTVEVKESCGSKRKTESSILDDEDEEPGRYTISLVTDEGEMIIATTDSEGEAKEKANKLLDLIKSGSVHVFDIATGNERWYDSKSKVKESCGSKRKTESGDQGYKKFSEITDEELRNDNVEINVVPLSEEIPFAWDPSVTVKGDTVVITGSMSPGGAAPDGVVTIEVPKELIDKYYKFLVTRYNESLKESENKVDTLRVGDVIELGGDKWSPKYHDRKYQPYAGARVKVVQVTPVVKFVGLNNRGKNFANDLSDEDYISAEEWIDSINNDDEHWAVVKRSDKLSKTESEDTNTAKEKSDDKKKMSSCESINRRIYANRKK